MSEFEWKTLGGKVSEKTEEPNQEEAGSSERKWFGNILEIGAKAGIILAVIAFISENEYRHNERTERSFQALNANKPQSDLAAMAIDYLNRDIHYPMCPFKSFCLIRSRRSFENFDFYSDRRDEGIRLERDNMAVRALQNAKIKSSDLRKITISEISLERASFVDVKMQGAKLYDVDLTCSSFQNADLSKAEIYFKSIAGAQFLGTNISGLTFPDIDPAEDEGKRDPSLEKRGLRPHTFAGAWAWRGEEPNLPKVYQTYEVCDKPADINQAVNGEVSKPQNCVAKTKVTTIPVSVCQQLEASSGTGQAIVSWVDRQINYLKGQ